MLKIWVFLESEFDSLVLQQLTPSIKTKTNLMKNKQQQSFIFILVHINVTSSPANTFIPLPPNFILVYPNVTFDFANVFSSTIPIHQSTIILGPAQIGLILPVNLPQQFFNTFANFYIQISLIKVNKMLPATITAQFI